MVFTLSTATHPRDRTTKGTREATLALEAAEAAGEVRATAAAESIPRRNFVGECTYQREPNLVLIHPGNLTTPLNENMTLKNSR